MYYATNVNTKNLKMVIGKSSMCFDEMQNYIFRLERRALSLFPTLSAFCKHAQLEKKIFCRLRQRGLYSINYLTLLRLCYGLKLSPNQVMRFEEWEDTDISPIELNQEILEKVRIDWKKSYSKWVESTAQKPKTEKRYGVAKF